MLELAFSVLYESDEHLNFIAPDKHEVRARRFSCLRVLDVGLGGGHRREKNSTLLPRLLVSPPLQYCMWTDGLNALLGKEMTSDYTKSDMDTLLSMEMKLRLLDLENIQIPEAPPPIPKEPSNYDFVYDCN